MKKCPECSAELEDSVKFCTVCGATQPQQQTTTEPDPQPQTSTENVTVASYTNPNSNAEQTTPPDPYIINQQEEPQKNGNDGFAIAGFVISLISVLCCCNILGILSLIFSMFGMKSVKYKTLSVVALVLSILALVLMVLSAVYSIVYMSQMGDIFGQMIENPEMFEEFYYNFEYQMP